MGGIANDGQWAWLKRQILDRGKAILKIPNLGAQFQIICEAANTAGLRMGIHNAMEMIEIPSSVSSMHW
ncbi:MAG: hypothetical protein AAGB19_00080 [Cyanobacteria bacterium P01_F01_bin.3]